MIVFATILRAAATKLWIVVGDGPSPPSNTLPGVVNIIPASATCPSDQPQGTPFETLHQLYPQLLH